MRLRKAVSPLLATIILLILVIAGSIVVYGIFSGKPNAFGRTRELGSKVGSWGQDFYVFSTGTLEWQLKLDDGSYWSIVSSTPVSVGSWYDLAFAVDTSTDKA